MRRPTAPARALRGSVVALVGLGVAVAGHAYAAGGVPVSPLVVVVAVLVLVATILVSRQRWTRGRLVVALSGMQVAMHAALWFDTGGRAADERLSAVASAGVGHQHTTATSHASALMVAAHVVAVLLAVVLLAAVEAALVVLQALATRILRESGSVVPTLVRLRVAEVRDRAVARVLELGAVGRRGPPGRLAPA